MLGLEVEINGRGKRLEINSESWYCRQLVVCEAQKNLQFDICFFFQGLKFFF